MADLELTMYTRLIEMAASASEALELKAGATKPEYNNFTKFL